jgi:hypothetical protein
MVLPLTLYILVTNVNANTVYSTCKVHYQVSASDRRFALDGSQVALGESAAIRLCWKNAALAEDPLQTRQSMQCQASRLLVHQIPTNSLCMFLVIEASSQMCLFSRLKSLKIIEYVFDVDCTSAL